MEWTDIRLTVAKADADNAEAVATMIAEGGIYIEDYSDIEQQVAEIAHVDLIEQELLDKPRASSSSPASSGSRCRTAPMPRPRRPSRTSFPDLLVCRAVARRAPAAK